MQKVSLQPDTGWPRLIFARTPGIILRCQIILCGRVVVKDVTQLALRGVRCVFSCALPHL